MEDKTSALGQYFTPWWAAEQLLRLHLPELGASDAVLEPSCGRGAFLAAIPDEALALGVEIDEGLAAVAAHATGRPVIAGDFCELAIDFEPSAIVGNPPFNLPTVERFLARAIELLPPAGRCAFLLPAYACQTPRRVLGWARVWGLEQVLVPRTLFMRSRLPLLFVTFTKGQGLPLRGFSLYAEAEDVVTSPARRALEHGTWREVVVDALRRLGGAGDLAAIYRQVEPRRPSGNPWWREKVRQQVQRVCTPISRGTWRLSA